MTTLELRIKFHVETGKYCPMMVDEQITPVARYDEYITYLEELIIENSIVRISGKVPQLVFSVKEIEEMKKSTKL